MIIARTVKSILSAQSLNSDAINTLDLLYSKEQYSQCCEFIEDTLCHIECGDTAPAESGILVVEKYAWSYYYAGNFESAKDVVVHASEFLAEGGFLSSIHVLEGWLYIKSGRFHTALNHARRNIKIAKASDHTKQMPNLLMLRGMAQYRLGALIHASEDLKGAIALSRVLGDTIYECHSLNAYGLVLMTQGRYQESRAILMKALGCAKGIHQYRKQLHVLINIAIVELKCGEYAAADEHCLAADVLLNKIEDSTQRPSVMILKAKVALLTGKCNVASRMSNELLAIVGNGQEARYEPLVLEMCGDISLNSKNIEGAARYYRRALSVAQAQAPSGDIVAECLRRLASLRVRSGEYFEAVPLLKEAIEAAEKCGERYEVGVAYRDLSIAYRKQSHFLQAIENSRISVELFREMGARRELAESLLEAARVRHGWYAMRADDFDFAMHADDTSPYSHLEEAWSFAIESYQVYEEMGDEVGQLSCEELMDQMRDQGHPIWLRKSLEKSRHSGMRVGTSPFIANAPSMRKLLTLVEIASSTEEPVLVTGETGTGKELIARMVHDRSERAKKPFVPVNCAAIPETLFEREFFGHAKGAFTGAEAGRSGLCEEADGGTLFLDEIGDMPSYLQVKLLRLLQEGTYRRLGDPEERRVDLRIVAATNAPLPDLIAAGRFREDLYYRLQTLEMPLPPLRQRPEDLVDLMDLFVRKALKDDVKAEKIFAPGVMTTFLRYPWPGNVRELEAMTRRMALMARHSGQGTVDMLPEQLARWREGRTKQQGSLSLSAYMETAERGRIDQALILKSGNRSEAARALGISRNQLYRKMEKLGIRAPR